MRLLRIPYMAVYDKGCILVTALNGCLLHYVVLPNCLLDHVDDVVVLCVDHIQFAGFAGSNATRGTADVDGQRLVVGGGSLPIGNTRVHKPLLLNTLQCQSVMPGPI